MGLKKLFSIKSLLILFFLFIAGTGLSGIQSDKSAHAQSQGVTPTLYCLGASCPVDPNETIVPSEEVSLPPDDSIGPSETISDTDISPQPSTITTDPDPCVAQNSVQTDKKKLKRGGGGFLESFFRFLFRLFELLLRLGGYQLPNPTPGCPPNNGNPVPPGGDDPSDSDDDDDSGDDDSDDDSDDDDSDDDDGSDDQDPVPSDDPSTNPQPSGPTTSTCTPQSGALEDQDMSDDQSPWKRNGAAKVVINFSTEGVPAAWVKEMQHGANVWNRSGCLDVRLVPSCSGASNCIPVEVGDGGGDSGNFNADESGGFTTGGDIQLDKSLTGKVRTNVTAHEMGHAVGLRHRKTEDILMHADDNNVIEADEIDYRNLRRLYASQNGTNNAAKSTVKKRTSHK